MVPFPHPLLIHVLHLFPVLGLVLGHLLSLDEDAMMRKTAFVSSRVRVQEVRRVLAFWVLD